MYVNSIGVSLPSAYLVCATAVGLRQAWELELASPLTIHLALDMVCRRGVSGAMDMDTLHQWLSARVQAFLTCSSGGLLR